MRVQTTGPVYRQCTGKHTYLQKREAKSAALRYNASRKGPPLAPYRCEICGKLHIGHLPTEKMKPSRRRAVMSDPGKMSTRRTSESVV
jgi:hypothetical protein